MPKKASTSCSNDSRLVAITTEGVPKLHCPACSRSFTALNAYVLHIKKHDAPGGFKCRYCKQSFCYEHELKQHREQVHTTIVCRICESTGINNTFGNEEQYREHIRSAHNGVDRELFSCNKCGVEYKTAENYQRHIETKCGSVKPFQCDQCELSFMTKYNLKYHQRAHSGESKYCCSYCGKNYMQKGRLLEHERSHTGEKPYKCDVCGKCFAHRESIVTHMTMHTGIRLVHCKCCNTSFSCHSNLLKHRRLRPDTCGQSIYDADKKRLRMNRTRIPPNMNPTSEIKVCKSNKVIKVKDKKNVRRTNRKRNANHVKHEEHASSNDGHEQINDDIIEKNQEQTITSNAAVAAKNVCDDSLLKPIKENTTDFDGLKAENKQTPTKVVLSIKTERIDSDENEDEQEFLQLDENIFNEKDKLLDCLLNADELKIELNDAKKQINVTNEQIVNDQNDDDVVQNAADSIMPFSDDNDDDDKNAAAAADDKNSIETVILQEPEIVLIADELLDTLVEQEEQQQQQQQTDEEFAAAIEKKPKRKRQRKKTQVAITENKLRLAKLNSQEVQIRLKKQLKNEQSWSCPYCIKVYNIRKPFENHLRDVHKSTQETIQHLFKMDDIGVLNEDIFKCHICDKIYLMEKRLKAHIKLHGADGKLVIQCPCRCNQFFATRDEAKAHAQSQHHEQVYCEICKKYMTAHDSLKSHMRKLHMAEQSESQKKANASRNLICEKCGKKFNGRTALTDHTRSDCGQKRIYVCNVCGKTLSTAGILKTHLLLHKDETPYQCEQCGKTFKVKAQYSTHIKTRHTNGKPYKCHLCPKEYAYRESLFTHMCVHTGFKRFVCNGCGKRFSCISNLQAHRKVHAESCGLLPLNSKAAQYMGVQKGELLLGAKPEPGLDYETTNTLLAKQVLTQDLNLQQQEVKTTASKAKV